MKSFLANLVIVGSLSLTLIRAGDIQDKLNQIASDMNNYAILTQTTSEELSIL